MKKFLNEENTVIYLLKKAIKINISNNLYLYLFDNINLCKVFSYFIIFLITFSYFSIFVISLSLYNALEIKSVYLSYLFVENK